MSDEIMLDKLRALSDIMKELRILLPRFENDSILILKCVEGTKIQSKVGALCLNMEAHIYLIVGEFASIFMKRSFDSHMGYRLWMHSVLLSHVCDTVIEALTQEFSPAWWVVAEYDRDFIRGISEKATAIENILKDIDITASAMDDAWDKFKEKLQLS